MLILRKTSEGSRIGATSRRSGRLTEDGIYIPWHRSLYSILPLRAALMVLAVLLPLIILTGTDLPSFLLTGNAFENDLQTIESGGFLAVAIVIASFAFVVFLFEQFSVAFAPEQYSERQKRLIRRYRYIVPLYLLAILAFWGYLEFILGPPGSPFSVEELLALGLNPDNVIFLLVEFKRTHVTIPLLLVIAYLEATFCISYIRSFSPYSDSKLRRFSRKILPYEWGLPDTPTDITTGTRRANWQL